MKNIFAINGSAGSNTANQKLIGFFATQTRDYFNVTVFNRLKELPPFDPELALQNPPSAVVAFRNAIDAADAVLICTPEYIFSIPSGLKNALEWCVATTVFSSKPAGLITASASGEKGQEQLLLILKTLSARTTPQTTLLIQGIKGKIKDSGALADEKTSNDLHRFILAFRQLLSQEA